MVIEKRSTSKFVLYGDEAERLAQRIDFEVPEAVNWFRKRLHKMGVSSLMNQAGGIPGDLLQIAEHEIEWL